MKIYQYGDYQFLATNSFLEQALKELGAEYIGDY